MFKGRRYLCEYCAGEFKAGPRNIQNYSYSYKNILLKCCTTECAKKLKKVYRSGEVPELELTTFMGVRAGICGVKKGGDLFGNTD